MRITSLAIAAISVAVATPAAAQNLVTNGSFETGSFAGWTLGNVGGGTAPVVITYGNTNGYPTGAFGEAIGPNSVFSRSPDAIGANVAYFSSEIREPGLLVAEHQPDRWPDLQHRV